MCEGLSLSLSLSLILSVGLLSSGCVSQMSNPHKDLTYQEASQILIKGKTTKADVEKRFGKPDAVSASNATERWTYHLIKSNALLGSMGTSAATIATSTAMSSIPFVGSGALMSAQIAAKSHASTAVAGAASQATNPNASKTLRIEFFKGVVKSFTLSSDTY